MKFISNARFDSNLKPPLSMSTGGYSSNLKVILFSGDFLLLVTIFSYGYY